MALYRMGVVSGGEDIEFIAPPYDSNETYNKGDACLKDGLTYVCNTDDTTGAWNSAKWDRDYLANMNSNSGGIPPKLLWTNSNPSSFSNQKISLDLSDYEGAIVEFLGWGNVAAGSSTVSRLYIQKNDPINYSGYRIGAGTQYQSNAPMIRVVEAIDNTGITFGNAYLGTGLNNVYMVPYKIYGVTKQNVDLGGSPSYVKYLINPNTITLDANAGKKFVIIASDSAQLTATVTNGAIDRVDVANYGGRYANIFEVTKINESLQSIVTLSDYCWHAIVIK